MASNDDAYSESWRIISERCPVVRGITTDEREKLLGNCPTGAIGDLIEVAFMNIRTRIEHEVTSPFRDALVKQIHLRYGVEAERGDLEMEVRELKLEIAELKEKNSEQEYQLKQYASSGQSRHEERQLGSHSGRSSYPANKPDFTTDFIAGW